MAAEASSSFWDMLSSHTKVAGDPGIRDDNRRDPAPVCNNAYKSRWTKEEEKLFKSTLFITTCARKLELDSVVKATSCWLFHKFYSCVHVDDYDEYVVAMTSIFLAGKIEETAIRIRDVITVAHRTMYPHRPLLEIDQTYRQLVDTLVQFELFMCRMLKFHLGYDSPHKYLLHYLKSLRDWLGLKSGEAQLCKMAWSLLNDCYHTKLCITSKADHLAVTVCYIAMESLAIKVPLEDRAEKTWWQVFVDDIKLSDITVLASQILELYENESVVK